MISEKLSFILEELSRFQLWSLLLYTIVAFIIYHCGKGGLSQEEYAIGGDEDRWRTVSTSLFIPLIIEFILDELAWMIYPSLRSHAKEDPVGHWFIIISLVPSSYVALWVIGEVNLSAREILISIGHITTLYGVLRKLETFHGEILGIFEPTVIFVLYALSEAVLCYAQQDKLDTVHQIASIGTLVLKVGVLVKIFSSARFRQVVLDRGEGTTFLTDRRYVAVILLFALTIFLVWDLLEVYGLLLYPLEHRNHVGQRILSHCIFVVIAGIFPGRITRRSLTTTEENNNMLREMAYKKTFVRYISHEVRSPLSTTSLALDYLLELLSGPEELLRSELVEIVNDCRSTCTTAIQTLSDLLLYDKLESNMLQLERAEVKCLSFIKECIGPMEKQIKFSGLKWVLDIDGAVNQCCVQADRLKIEQVLRNFITNAIKFTPAGGTISMKAAILSTGDMKTNDCDNQADDTIKTNKEDVYSSEIPYSPMQRSKSRTLDHHRRFSDDEIFALEISGDNSPISNRGALCFRCEITDTGPGIAYENQDKLFGQYIQFDANKLQKGGGSVSKAIIEAHGGIVGMHSEGLGRGSTFFFELPAYIEPTLPTSTSVNDLCELVDVDDSALKRPASLKIASPSNQRHLSDLSANSVPPEQSIPRLSSHTNEDDHDHDDDLEVHVVHDQNGINLSLSHHSSFTNHENDLPVSPDLADRLQLQSGGGSDRLVPATTSLPKPAPLFISPLVPTPKAKLLGLTGEEADLASTFTLHTYNLHILLADDTALARKIVERVLTSTHFSFTYKGKISSSAANAANGIDLLKASFPTVFAAGQSQSSGPSSSISGSSGGRSSSVAEVPSSRAVDNPHKLGTPFLTERKSSRTLSGMHDELDNHGDKGSSHHNLIGKAISEDSFGSLSNEHLVDSITDPSMLDFSNQLTTTNLSAASHVLDRCETPLSSVSSHSSGSLNRIFITCDHAANGQIAVDKVLQALEMHKAYDIVLIDYYMPVLDGPAAIERIRKAGYEGIIIAVTGSASKEDKEKLLAVGATAVMCKPFDVKHFQHLIVKHRHLLHL
eukprot:scaffold381_cov168-Ochromonas_danica.AAC.12